MSKNNINVFLGQRLKACIRARFQGRAWQKDFLYVLKMKGTPISAPALSALTAGKNAITHKRAEQFAPVLGVPAGYLLGLVDAGTKGEPIDPNFEFKADYGKEQLSLVPRQIIRDIAAVRMFGVKKYKDPDNWKRVEVERYRDAAFRHWLAYLDDPNGVDAESGLPHLWHLACNIAFLCEMEDKKTGTKLVQVKSHGDKITTEIISVDIGDTAECFKKT